MGGLDRPATTAERLQIALSNLKLKQIELSRLCGIDRGTINNYVLGKYEPKSDAVAKMAMALNVSEMWLWGYDVPMERETTPPESITLTEGESMLLELFRRVPEEHQQMVLDMIRIALKQNQ